MTRSKGQTFFRSVCALAIPVALQSMLQASFGVVDQVMIGQLGSVEVAAVGLAGKFTGIFNVVVSAVGAVAGIMISQYMGQKNAAETRRSLVLNLRVCLIIAVLFTLVGVVVPKQIMGLYINDNATAETAGRYLTIVSGTFLPTAGVVILSTSALRRNSVGCGQYRSQLGTDLRAAWRTDSRSHRGSTGYADLAICIFRGHLSIVSEIQGKDSEHRAEPLRLEAVFLYATAPADQ